MAMRDDRRSIRFIAKRLCRAPCPVSRELQRLFSGARVNDAKLPTAKRDASVGATLQARTGTGRRVTQDSWPSSQFALVTQVNFEQTQDYVADQIRQKHFVRDHL
jgi:hypothetical protein